MCPGRICHHFLPGCPNSSLLLCGNDPNKQLLQSGPFACMLSRFRMGGSITVTDFVLERYRPESCIHIWGKKRKIFIFPRGLYKLIRVTILQTSFFLSFTHLPYIFMWHYRPLYNVNTKCSSFVSFLKNSPHSNRTSPCLYLWITRITK